MLQTRPTPEPGGTSGFDGEPNLDQDLDDDARWALLERNLAEQGRLAEEVEQTRPRAVAPGVARETADRLGRAGRDDELATEVADAVLDAVLQAQVVLDAVAAPVFEEGSDQGDGRVAAQQRLIRLQVRTWQLVDAVLDNVISVRTSPVSATMRSITPPDSGSAGGGSTRSTPGANSARPAGHPTTSTS